MKITPCGAAGEVTGSGYLVETSSATVLVDFGMFQGEGASTERNREIDPVDPMALDAVVLTHAHLDHCGRLPLLPMHGFRGPVHATPATIDFTELILTDSAYLQEMDTMRLNRRRRRAGREAETPLYTKTDVATLLPQMQGLPYGERREIASGISIRMVDAGHILGSASVEMTIEDAGRRIVVVFSGDIGPKGQPILEDPKTFAEADFVFMESTYGDREHRPIDDTVEEFRGILANAIAAESRVLIPAFAVGRTQTILYYLAELRRAGRLGEFPVHLDSPMAIRATRLYEKHLGLFDTEARDLLRKGRFRDVLKSLHFSETAEESMALNQAPDPCLIVAASGMCDGGRIMHHLKHNLWRRDCAVMIVGFQTNRSLGRRLIDGAKMVTVLGEEVVVRANIHTLGGFSAHAGREGLLEWFGALAGSRPRLALVHGEDEARASLSGAIRDRFGVESILPQRGEPIEI